MLGLPRHLRLVWREWFPHGFWARIRLALWGSETGPGDNQ